MVLQWLRNTKNEFGRDLTWPLVLTSGYASVSPQYPNTTQLLTTYLPQLAGMSYGLDLNYWSGFLGMPQFQHDFGIYSPTTQTYTIPTTWQSIASGTPTAAIACGTLVAGYMGNRWGRIRSFWIAACVAIVGILIQASAIGSFWQVLVGRIVNGGSMGVICKYAFLPSTDLGVEDWIGCAD